MQDGQDNVPDESTPEDPTWEEGPRAESPPGGAPPETDAAPARTGPAIVIGPLIIQSGATPVIAVIMLVAGMIIGFLMNPGMRLPAAVPSDPATRTPAAPSATAVTAAGPTRTPAPPTATVNPTVVAQQRKELAAYVSSNTRHFKGNANAPVTFIEFSDYQ